MNKSEYVELSTVKTIGVLADEKNLKKIENTFYWMDDEK